MKTLLLLLALTSPAPCAETGVAIQNVETGKNLRPYEAGAKDGNRIVLYDAINWKCMTWKMEKVADNTYTLRNFFTGKTIQPSEAPLPGVSVFQQPLKKDAPQQWEFLKQPDGAYMIRLKGTELFISISSDKTNSAIVLQPDQKSKKQEWKLLEQNPIY